MSTTIETLATWAAGRFREPAAIPAHVRLRARLRHLSQAGAARAGAAEPTVAALREALPRRGSAPLVTGGSSSRVAAVRHHAAAAAALAFGDDLFLGSAGHGGPAATWALGRGRTVGEVLGATVLADEVAGRIVTAAALGPGGGQLERLATAAGAAVAAGLLGGLEAPALAHALALALVPLDGPAWAARAGDAAGALAVGEAAARGFEAAELARAGATGDLGLLDGPAFAALAGTPLAAAFTGLDEAWLVGTLGFRLHPGLPPVHPPLQGVLEILARHVRAADKPLRPDQVESVRLRCSAPAWALHRAAPGSALADVRRAVATALVAGGYGPVEAGAAWQAEHAEAVAAMEERVRVEHDWTRTLAALRAHLPFLDPLLAGLDRCPRRALLRRAAGLAARELPRPAVEDLAGMARALPLGALFRLGGGPADLAGARLDEWQPRLDAGVELFTTRGGRWPERRTIPEGAPGWSWAATVEGVLAKHAGAGGRAWLETPEDAGFEPEAILAPA